jgi:hypothetical protein
MRIPFWLLRGCHPERVRTAPSRPRSERPAPSGRDATRGVARSGAEHPRQWQVRVGTHTHHQRGVGVRATDRLQAEPKDEDSGLLADRELDRQRVPN